MLTSPGSPEKQNIPGHEEMDAEACAYVTHHDRLGSCVLYFDLGVPLNPSPGGRGGSLTVGLILLSGYKEHKKDGEINDRLDDGKNKIIRKRKHTSQI